ncbi:malonic semialdehyde reductase [Sphingosinicella microcystinivorans]|uniref:malonic semialdehyde reductase n=1 Tax=Sphingosinicella microcystinivorans TaxID=335406 RepID=UPI0022F3E0A7|nr:malonic semialdehyde reductase [Sphingosinicella microcystinivorans]WBX85636.1 malonic semialdehyde reductase [Sphingosinicella microcystinivorans]
MTDHLLSDRDLDLIFRSARTHNDWSDRPVSDVQLRAVYDLMRMGPTSANCEPARIVFAKSPEAREKLAACASGSNAPKIRQAPVTAIIGMDMKFYDQLPKLFPHTDARSWFTSNDALVRETAFRNSSLQGAYFIIAARAIGLNCGPMSGFDKAKVDAAFFAGTDIETNFICSIGYGTEKNLFPRSPRLSFEEAASIV